MLVYNPKSDQVKVVPWPDRTGLSRPYKRSVLACFSDFHEMPEEKRELTMFIEAYQGIVRDGVDPKAMHHAMLAIDEYRNRVAMEMLGAI